MTVNFENEGDVNLLLKALDGDEEATKIYCGSYKLIVVGSSGKSGMYRTKEVHPAYTEVKVYRGKSVYDKDGFLLPFFWSLPRI